MSSLTTSVGASSAKSSAPPPASASSYARYALFVLVLVFVFNFLDRQILSILAERIKADLGLTDAEMGFLYGTAFAVFYTVFGIPLGRLADVWDRRRLIAISLAFWSVMTALSGLSRTFGQLGAARIGVGIGEAGATPAAFSLLSDYFPKRLRATVMAIYTSGIYIGAGLGVFLGGLVVDRWDHAYAGSVAPFGLRGWHVAFFTVGIPGLLLAVIVARLREPRRGQMEESLSVLSHSNTAPPPENGWRVFLTETLAIVPPFTLWSLLRAGVGAAGILFNLAMGGVFAGLAWFLTRLFGTPVQWWALLIGLFAAASWVQNLRKKDHATFHVVFKTPSLTWSALGCAFTAFVSYALAFWTPPYFVRVLHVNVREAGLYLGLTSAVGGLLGTTLGGLLADRFRRKSPAGRLWVLMAAAVLPLPFVWLLFSTSNVNLAYALNVPVSCLAAMWLGAGGSTVTELVMPRMRGTASAVYLLVINFIGLAMGPYTIGRISAATGSLRTAILSALVGSVVSLLCSALACRTIGRDEATLAERVRALT